MYMYLKYNVSVGNAYIDGVGYFNNYEYIFCRNCIIISCENSSLYLDEHLGKTVIVSVVFNNK